MSNIVLITNGQLVTTTLAIADGTENSHEAVIKLARRYRSDLEEFGLVGFEIQPKPAGQRGGSDTEYALLNEQQATLLMTYMRNSDVVRAFKKQLVKAFYELAQQQNQRDPIEVLNDPSAMRGLLLTYTEKVIALEAAVAEQAPKVEALDRIATADGSLCITDTAKHLQVRPKDLFTWLQQKGWIYRRPGGTAWLGYQHRVQQGLLEHKVTTVSRADGSEKITEQVRVTPKGMTRLALELRTEQLHVA